MKSPLTNLEVNSHSEARTDTSFYYDPACGKYAVGFDAHLDSLSPNEKYQIAKVLASRTLRTGETYPMLTHDRTGAQEVWNCMPTSSLITHYPSDVVYIIDEALINLSKLVSFPSDRIEITEVTRWYIYCHDQESQEYMLRQLTDLGYIKHAASRSGGSHMIPSYTIEANGWLRLQELDVDSSTSQQAFVAMWFSDEMQSIYDNAIDPAIKEAGYNPLRIDLKEHNNKICDEIIAEVRRSRFVVADFSGNRGGVYYEAGFAHGLGIPVIWTIQAEHLKDVHFDTRQYNHIVYESEVELKEKLFHRIRVTQ